jgi:hypothetical protein
MASETSPLADGQVEDPPASRRPDGRTPMTVGWVCLAVSLVLVAISLTIKTDIAEGSRFAILSRLDGAADKLRNILNLRVAAGAFFSLFLVLWGVGYIVRAISFLPGKDD